MKNKKDLNENLAKIREFLLKNATAIEAEATNHHLEYIGKDNVRIKILKKLIKAHIHIVLDIAERLETDDIKQRTKYFNEQGEKLGKRSIYEGLSLEEAVNGTVFLKQAIWKKVNEAGLLDDFTAKDMFYINQTIGTYIDALSSKIAFSYHENYTEKLKKETEKANQEHVNVELLMNTYDDERKRLEFGQAAGSIGTYEWDLKTMKSVWTKELEALYGYPKGGLRSDNTETWLKYIHPDDRKKVMDETNKAIKKSDTLNTEFRIIWPDGTTHYLSNRAKIIRDKKGKATRMIGVNIDVTHRKTIENNLNYLSMASKALASSLDYKKTLATVAKLAVPEIADWCSVTMKNGNKIETLAVAHVDPEKVKWARELGKKNPPNPNAKTGLPNVLRTGKSELYPEVNEELIIKNARSKEEAALIRKLKMSSVMIVPFLADRKAIGAISFVAAESGRHYTKADLAMAEEVASRMALAIQNAKLFTEVAAADEVQKRLAAIVESSDDAIIGMSAEGIITNWNKGAQQLYGYKPEEVIGKPTSFLMSAEREDDFPKLIKLLHQGSKVEHYESKRKTKDGRIIDVSLTLSPIRNSQGKIIGASKVARDITARKQAEERQKFLEQASSILGATIDYEKTLKNLGELIVPRLADYCRIVVADEEKHVKEIALNHKDKKKLSLVKELYDTYNKDTGTTSGVEHIIKTGKSELMSYVSPEIVSRSASKVQKIVKALNLQSYIGVPMKIGNKTVGVITLSSTDKKRIYTEEDLNLAEELSSRAALAVENARLYAGSQQAVSIRDEFISVASHELRTPVTSLKMYTQVLKQLAEKQKENTLQIYFAKMDNQVNKLTILIDDLLNVSKLSHGKLEFNMEEFCIDDVVKEAVETLQQTSKNHQLVLSGEVKRNVYGDRYRIYQVITNLITNAVKYSPQANKVIVNLEQGKNGAKVSVQDFGIGIDEEHIGKLFNQFYRVSRPHEKTFPGLGLGLYISKQIIERHQGQITVSSNLGKGSQFSIILPYKPNHKSN